MGTYTAKRFQVGTTLAYAEIIELRDAAWVNDVRYVIRKTCCDKLELKSHKALRTAYQRHWDVCPLCQRNGKSRKASPLRIIIPSYVLRAPTAQAEKPQTIELVPTSPVSLPEWLCLAYTEWPKPPSVVARIWGQQ